MSLFLNIFSPPRAFYFFFWIGKREKPFIKKKNVYGEYTKRSKRPKQGSNRVQGKPNHVSSVAETGWDVGNLVHGFILQCSIFLFRVRLPTFYSIPSDLLYSLSI